MTTLPLMFAKTATSLIVSFSSTNSPSADFNNDGVVNTSDLVNLVGQLNQSCDGCATDLNNDGMTDATDLLELMGQWGDVPGYVQPINVNESSDSATEAQTEDLDLSWQGQGPILLDAIYYDELARPVERQELGLALNQGAQAKAWTAANNIAVQPMVYNGGVDWYGDGVYSDDDKRRFREWLDENVPQDYNGPICLDMESQWWPMFDTSNQAVMDTVINFYIEGLEYAQAQRPDAKFGYWGLPKKSHTKETSTTADVSRLLKASTALFPDVYDNNAVANGSNRLRKHIESAMAMVDGKVPVYVQASPRYKDANNQYTQLHTVDEFMRDQIDSSLAAVYTDADGKEHRIAGVSLWDAYVYFWWYTENWTTLRADVQKSIWDELDAYHVTLLEEMKASVDTAYAAAQERLGEATQEPTQMTESSEEENTAAKEIAIAALKTQQQQQQSILVRGIHSAQASITTASSSFQSSSRSYKVARSTWSKARRTFARTARKYGRNSSQYKKAYAAYKTARTEMQSASKEYQEDRDEFSSARASMNQAKQEWKTANEGWSEMAEAEQTLLASK